jgi:hypothetical protein
MKQINDKLDGLSELVTRIDAKILDINTKLDELIKALHEYDDESYGESSFEAFQDTKNDILSWDVDGAERRMDIIGQNGNEGLHYDSHHVTNEEADDDARSNNTQTKHVGEKKRNKRYYKPKAK